MNNLELYIKILLTLCVTFLLLYVGPILFNINSTLLVFLLFVMIFSFPFVVHLIWFYNFKRKDTK